MRSKHVASPAALVRAAGAAILILALGPSPASGDSILLHWTAPGDDGNVGRAAAYELRYAEAPISGTDTTSWWGGAAVAGPLPAPQTAGTRESFSVSGLTPGKTYYFVIRTWDDASNESGFSNVSVRQTAPSGTTLATPSGFVAEAVPGGVTLRWNEVTVDGGDGYRLYRSQGTGAAQLLHTAPLSETAWTDSSVAGGQQYEYSLVTYSSTAESDPAVATISLAGDLLTSATTEIHGYPNPAHDKVTFRFDGGTADGSAAHTRLVIYDLTGHRIRVLVDDVVPPGEQAVDWNCHSDAGGAVAPGLYTAILDGPRGRQTTRIAIIP